MYIHMHINHHFFTHLRKLFDDHFGKLPGHRAPRPPHDLQALLVVLLSPLLGLATPRVVYRCPNVRLTLVQ